MVKIIVFFVLLIQICVCEKISDAEYSLMPTLFHMDNYDDCMLVKKQSLFCFFMYQLEPVDTNNTSNIWKIIKKVSSDVRNYRHDILRHYICVRKTCPNALKNNKNELKEEIKKCYDEKYYNLGVNGTITDLKCSTADSKYSIEYFDILIAFILITYIIFVIMASLYDVLARYKNKEEYYKITSTKVGSFLSAFSIVKNWHRLTIKSSNTPSDMKKLKSIQGIRFFTMTGVILSHTQIVHSRGPLLNPPYLENVTKNFQNMVVVNASCVIQTYFIISFWLLTYHFFQTFDKHPTVQPKLLIFAIVNRIMRLLPSMIVAIALKATWFIHIGDGPLWDEIAGEYSRNCRYNWWVNLLFINNMFETHDMCSRDLWYLAADTHLFLLSLIVLTIIWKYRNKAKYIFGFCHIVSILIPAYVAYFNDYDVLHRQYPEYLYNENALKGDLYLKMYASTYSNLSGWMIGMTFGYLFYIYKDKKLFTKKIYVAIWWIISLGSCFLQIFSGYIFYQENYQHSPIVSALYWSLSKPLYSIGMATLIFGFTQDIGWFLKWFCEWHVMEVCGRLSYSIYVIHTLFIAFRGSLRRSPFYSLDILNMYYVLGDICMSLVGGLIICLLVEMPISALQKRMIPQLSDQRSKKDAEETKNKHH